MSQHASSSSPQELSAALAALVARAGASVVGVHSHRARSSGFFWRPGLVVTADEALADEGEVALALPGGASVPATVAGRDPTTDIALLRVESGEAAPAALLTTALAVGELALAVGAQEGAPVAAFGMVGVAGPGWRSLRGGEIDARIELDMSLRGHAEGGLTIDMSGRAFGMAVFGPRRRVLVIPAATIERVAARLETNGRIARGYLGLALQQVKLDGDAATGAMVMRVDRNGPGAAAGLQQGDVIAAWNGEPVRSVRAMLRALGPESVGTRVTLTVRRGGEPIEVVLTVGERPPA